MIHSGDNNSGIPLINGEPISSIYLPIFDTMTTTSSTRKTVGIASFLIQWKTYLQSSSVVTTINPTIYCVLETECQDTYTYVIRNKEVQFLAVGDVHDTHYDYAKKSTTLQFNNNSTDGINIQYSSSCPVLLTIYPSKDFYETYHTDEPLMLAFFVTAILSGIFVLFIFYDRIVERRTQKVLKKAVQSSAVVSNLFPKNVLDKLTSQHNSNNHHHNENDSNQCDQSTEMNTLQGYLNNGFDDSIQATIADLFPHTTGKEFFLLQIIEDIFSLEIIFVSSSTC
jgi:hypothetical protein